MPPTRTRARKSQSHSRCGFWDGVIGIRGPGERGSGAGSLTRLGRSEGSIRQVGAILERSSSPCKFLLPVTFCPRALTYSLGYTSSPLPPLPNRYRCVMRHTFTLLVLAVVAPALAADVTFPKFKAQEIATDLTVGYAVIVADINEDGKPDIVVVDSKRVVWYENPTWKVHTIIAGKTKPDNVCVVAHDIDGDGHLDLVVGADWNPSNTKTGGTLQWLKRGKTLDEEWTVYPIGEEPTAHRVRMADIDGDGKKEIILTPLHGREATAKGNWVDGRPVRILAFPIPRDPVKGPWTPKVLSEELHVVHNVWPMDERGSQSIFAASYEGVSVVHDKDDVWKARHTGEGNQSNA